MLRSKDSRDTFQLRLNLFLTNTGSKSFSRDVLKLLQFLVYLKYTKNIHYNYTISMAFTYMYKRRMYSCPLKRCLYLQYLVRYKALLNTPLAYLSSAIVNNLKLYIITYH